MFWLNLLGSVASASVLATFCMNSMVPLRAVAICSNVLFAAYGSLTQIYPVLVLHAILLPINCVRLLQALIGVKEPYAALIAWAPSTTAFMPGELPLNEKWRETKHCFAEWRRRARSRQDLMALSDRDLRDIHATRCDALHEARKPFWRK